MVLCRELRLFVLDSVHQTPSFELSRSTFGQFFRFFILRGDPYDFGVVKSYTEWKKWSEKRRRKKLTKWNRKMGGRSFIITSGAFEGTLLYMTPPHYTWQFYITHDTCTWHITPAHDMCRWHVHVNFTPAHGTCTWHLHMTPAHDNFTWQMMSAPAPPNGCFQEEVLHHGVAWGHGHKAALKTW